MCLYTNTNIPTILKEDLLVYKMCEFKNNGLYSICVNHHYSLKETALIKIEKTNLIRGEYQISSGLHAYVNKYANCNSAFIIPRGSKVYYDNNGKGIVSNKLNFSHFVGIFNYININTIKWAKPSIIRWIKKMYRYYKGNY